LSLSLELKEIKENSLRQVALQRHHTFLLAAHFLLL
jgi:hypothetical protein